MSTILLAASLAQAADSSGLQVAAVAFGGAAVGTGVGFATGGALQMATCQSACTWSFVDGGLKGMAIGYPVGALLAGGAAAWTWGLDTPRAMLVGGLVSVFTFGMMPLVVEQGFAAPLLAVGGIAVPASIGLAATDWGLTPSFSAAGTGLTLSRRF